MTIYDLIEKLKQFPSDATVQYMKWQYNSEEYEEAHILEEMRYDPNAKKLIF